MSSFCHPPADKAATLLHSGRLHCHTTCCGEWMKKSKAERELRLQMLEYARQVSFDISTTPGQVDPTQNVPAPQSWRTSLYHDDRHTRNIFRALALIEKLKSSLNSTPKEDWRVFGELPDVTSERFLANLAMMDSSNNSQCMIIEPRTKIGGLFMEIVSLIAVSGDCFLHYNLHPYIQHFIKNNAKDINYSYCSHFVFSGTYVNLLSCKSQRERVVELAGLLSVAKHIAPKIDDSFTGVMCGLLSAELNEAVSNFEKKGTSNAVALYDFLTGLQANDKYIEVVMKVSFEFHAVSKNTHDPTKMKKSADHFAKAIEDFSTSIRKATALNGLVKMVSILRAPDTKPWHNECYITLSFPKRGYPFNYNKGSLALWDKCDSQTLAAMRVLLGKKHSKNYTEIAKELNELTGDGKNIELLIAGIKDAKKEVATARGVKKSNNDIQVELRQHQIIFDSLAFLNSAEKRWRASVEKQLVLEGNASSGYEARLHAMTLLDDKKSIPVISTPAITPVKPQGTYSKDAVKQLVRYNFIQHNLQMQPYSSPQQTNKPLRDSGEMKLGLPESDNMLSEMLKTSMVTLFFMTLKLHGTQTKLDEVRNTFAKGKKEKYTPSERAKTSPSLSAISKIFDGK